MAIGVCTANPTNSSYRTSQNMWMYATNGDLYVQGARMEGVLPRLSAGSVVRCVLDMDEGALYFCVNGGRRLDAAVYGLLSVVVFPAVAFANTSGPARIASVSGALAGVGKVASGTSADGEWSA
jgi:hypothetical protein